MRIRKQGHKEKQKETTKKRIRKGEKPNRRIKKKLLDMRSEKTNPTRRI